MRLPPLSANKKQRRLRRICLPCTFFDAGENSGTAYKKGSGKKPQPKKSINRM